MKELRGSTKNMLALDAGDLLFKKFTQPIAETESNLLAQQAYLIIESLNLMGYNLLGIGDDDLTLGKELLSDVSKKANFPFLSSNVLDEESGRPLFQSSLVKRVNGLRIGIFSLLSPDAFSGPGDPRRRGIIVRSPSEMAQAMVKELRPKTDLIVLLSHLGYSKDMELAQAVSGIHFIIGSHTGITLNYPTVVKNTVILQAGPKGMAAGRFDVILRNKDAGFYNGAVRLSAESDLANIKNRLNGSRIPVAETAQLLKMKQDTERKLQQFQGKNEFENTMTVLNETIKDHPEIAKWVKGYRENGTFMK